MGRLTLCRSALMLLAVLLAGPDPAGNAGVARAGEEAEERGRDARAPAVEHRGQGAGADPAPGRHALAGAARCKSCHPSVYDAWSATPHASRGLDCEYCHGAGGDYASSAVMRSPARARAAGLGIPSSARCALCHRASLRELRARVHPHGNR